MVEVLFRTPRRACGPRGRQDTEILIGDVGDAASLAAIARRTKVVIAMAGPYAKFGEPVVAACIAEGTHYVDITGAPPSAPPPLDYQPTGTCYSVMLPLQKPLPSSTMINISFVLCVVTV